MILPGGTALTRDDLVEQIKRAREVQNEWIRRQVIENDRVDILATEVLGYKLQPFHAAMLHYSMVHKHTLQLAFRGAGKTTSVEIVRVIHDILKDRDVRILIASKTVGFAQNVLREIKQHFEENERFREIFGDLVDDSKWDQSEIQVRGRSRPMKESTVTCVGIGGQLIGKHFDKAYCDDLVDEDNSRTENARNFNKTWYYKVLHPTLEPHSELHLFGTRYHFSDLYGWLQINEMRDTTQIIPALDESGRSPWPEKYPSTYFREKREALGTVIFSSQFQCDAEAMKGEIFQPDWFGVPISDGEVPDKARYYAGIDLAIKKSETADLFATCGIAVHGADIFIVALYTGHLSFSEQTAHIIEWWKSGMGGIVDPRKQVQYGIEVNAYQDAQYQRLKEECPEMALRPITTLKDKVTRAHKLAARFEEGRIRVHKRVYNRLMDHLLQFPGGRYKDVFDALDLAVTVAFKRRRTSRNDEIGVI